MERVDGLAPAGQGGVLEVARDEVGSALDELLRDGAQRMLMQAVLAEVDDYVAAHQHERGPDGCRLVVRNGLGKARTLVTPVGAMRVRAPRVRDDRRDEEGQPLRFVSQILPPYLRRTKSVSELIPWLYLKGISTGDFSEALGKLLGPDAPGLSSTTVVRLKQVWLGEYDTWRKRDLSHERYVYMWVDGIHCNVRLDDERQCFLVIIGATQDGRKQLLAVEDGFRESEASWKAVLEDLKARGLATPPKLAVGDGALGFWAALPQVYGPTREQRCWVHKTANVLDKMPKSAQGKGRQMIHDIYLAETRKQAEAAFDKFIATYGAKLPKAVECLKKDRDQLLAFYDFPAEHWAHLRTTNPVESTFATVRLRHRRTKGSGSREASLTMVFMLARQAESHWRRLNGSNALVQVIQGKKFQDGVLVQENAA